MADEWFYVENGKSLGPVSIEDLRRRISVAGDAPQFVWTPGMPEWVEARTLPQFTLRPSPTKKPHLNSISAPAKARPAPATRAATAVVPLSSGDGLRTKAVAKAKALAHRARHELVAYAAIASYLMVWFVAVMFYKATILRSVGIEFTPVGFAVVKALILAKFMLLLEAVKLGERREGEIMAVQILKKALLFTLALIFMSMIEEVVVGYFHGRGAKEVLQEMAGGSLAQVLASAILMFLVLLPYMAFRRVALAVGDLPEMLFKRGAAPKAE